MSQVHIAQISRELYPHRPLALGSAVEAFVDLDRAVWKCLYEEKPLKGRWRPKPRGWELTWSHLGELLDKSAATPQFISRTVSFAKTGKNLSATNLQRPYSIALKSLAGAPDADIRYHCYRSMRRKYKQANNDELVAAFRSLSNLLPLVLASLSDATRQESQKGKGDHRKFYCVDYAKLSKQLHAKSQQLNFSRSKDGKSHYILLFLECMRCVGYLTPMAYEAPPMVRIDATDYDVEFMIGCLYGLTTSIPGFDELFGGCGLALSDSLFDSSGYGGRPLGRACLIKGRFGTGKTLLALQLCAEVARKGGAARFNALEQPSAECAYFLRSMGALDDALGLSVVTTPYDLEDHTQRQRSSTDTRGVLALLDAPKESHEIFLSSLENDASNLNGFPLRLVAMDPLNSVFRERGDGNYAKLRAEFFDSIVKLKDQGTNVLFVSEEGGDEGLETYFEENVVDTVIRLSESHAHGYSIRQIEVQKSRLQREQRGKHPYSIKPGDGFHVYPSSAAVSAHNRRRNITPPDSPTDFGLETLDAALGPGAMHVGDVVAFRGPTGSLKTQLGLVFLCSYDRPELGIANRRSLLVAARDSREALRFQLEAQYLKRFRQEQKKAHVPTKPNDAIDVCDLPLGHIQPGYVLQTIESRFRMARKSDIVYDRVMITNIGHWELSCPFISDDTTFGDTLVALMRSQGVTSLFVCGEMSDETGYTVQKPIIDCADISISFERMELRGRREVSFRVLKSRGMRHQRERHAVALENGNIAVTPVSELIRFSSSGEARTLPVHLILHAETATQLKYNERWRDAVAVAFSSSVKVSEQRYIYDGGGLGIAPALTVDELQIVHLDAYQGGSRPGATGVVPTVPIDSGIVEKSAPNLPGQIVPRLRDKYFRNNTWTSMPMYSDIGFLCLDAESADGIDCSSWHAIAEASRNWSPPVDSDCDYVFFDLPHVTLENYACIFLEMLGECVGNDNFLRSRTSTEDFANVLSSNAGIKAGRLFRELVSDGIKYYESSVAAQSTPVEEVPSNRSSVSGGSGKPAICYEWHNKPRAAITRHWYSTLSEMLKGVPQTDLSQIRVTLTPGRTIAGEWSLAVPRHASARKLAGSLIANTMTRSAELERLSLGVGLPIRESFYSRESNEFNLFDPRVRCEVGGKEILNSVDKAMCRSHLRHYSRWARQLGECLRHLGLASIDDDSMDPFISDLLSHAACQIRNVGDAWKS